MVHPEGSGRMAEEEGLLTVTGLVAPFFFENRNNAGTPSPKTLRFCTVAL
jgi:hypothetical protein